MNFLLIVFSSYLVGPNQFSFVLPGRKNDLQVLFLQLSILKSFHAPLFHLHSFIHSAQE